MDDIRILGYCAECGNEITDDFEEYYCDQDGNLFCCNEHVLEFFNITQMEA